MKLCTNCKCGILCECNNKTSSAKSNNKKESVDHPDHYLKNSGHEVIDVINAWNLDFELGNVVKYIARAGRKDKNKVLEDLKKASWYLEHKIKKINK